MLFGLFCYLFVIFILGGYVVYGMFADHMRKKIALERYGIYIHKVGDGQFNVHLTRENFRNLEKLREAAGKSSLEETLRCALKLYDKEKHGE